ncbi:MAG: guanylate kinase [Betaproteobacteria bacterium]|jgi:guanylate kinase|nr:guanylate kinase [Betaproteobacteria bacterium]
MSGNLYIVSAPSGAGKTSLVAALLASDTRVRKSVSYTTRAPRPGEINGRHYHFTSMEQFEKLEAAGDLLESAVVHGNRYGTSKRWVEEQLTGDSDIVLEIDWQGAAQVRRLMPSAIAVFVLPPSFEALLQRLNSRAQDSPEVIATRLANAREEIAHVHDFDYVIINADFRTAAAELQDIVRTERLRTAQQLARHTALINRLN